MALKGEAKKIYQRRYMRERYWRLKGQTPPVPKAVIPKIEHSQTIAHTVNKTPLKEIIDKHYKHKKHGLLWRIFHK